MAKRDEWVKVKDEGELREGMAVQVRPCAACQRVDTGILCHREPVTNARDKNGRPCPAKFSWRAIGSCRDGLRGHVLDAIIDGRLFRLADDQLIDLSETRELETVRG